MLKAQPKHLVYRERLRRRAEMLHSVHVQQDTTFAGCPKHRAGSGFPERIERRLVPVVTSHLHDLPLPDAHQLAHRLIQAPAGVVGGRAHDGDDGLVTDREIEQDRTKRAPAEGPLPGQKIVADRGLAAVSAGQGATAREVPDRLVVKARRDAGQVSRRDGVIQAPHHGNILCCRHGASPTTHAMRRR
jgi:hypothetical protein